MLLQQLQQCGLPQQLPASLAAVNAQLREVTAQQQQNKSSSSGGSGIPVGSTIGGCINLSHIAMLAAAMLHCCEGLAQFQVEPTIVTPAAAVPAVELAMSMLRYADVALQQQQQQGEQQQGSSSSSSSRRWGLVSWRL
jgi:hypothetical protein